MKHLAIMKLDLTLHTAWSLYSQCQQTCGLQRLRSCAFLQSLERIITEIG